MVDCRVLTNGIETVVTTGAVICDAGVIKHAGGKSVGVMANTAILRSGDMRCWFTGSGRAIVAGGAIPGNVLMNEDRGTKRRGGVTKVAILRGGQMVCCRVLARRVLAVVTAFASRGNALVIEHARGKTVGVMADTAIFSGRYMVNRFPSRSRAVMATGAITGDAFVTKNSRNKRLS